MQRTSPPLSHEQRKIEKLLEQIAKKKPPQSAPPMNEKEHPVSNQTAVESRETLQTCGF